jgi:lantibiotic modifying enzyme
MAGWGMTNLKFWLATRKDIYLDNAKKAGEMLVARAQQTADGVCWPDQDGGIQLGLTHGASGTGLFLQYLNSATGNEKYKEMAVAALDYDISHAVKTDNGGLTWSKKSGTNDILYPYLEYGSAGIGIACLRYLKKLKDAKYLDLINKIHIECDRKYTIFPGRNNGLAGIGEFMLDGFAITKDKKYLAGAYRVASGIDLFAIQSEKGIAFPGNGLARISCDYATGISGIMLFLDRLATGRPADFMLDELL